MSQHRSSLLSSEGELSQGRAATPSSPAVPDVAGARKRKRSEKDEARETAAAVPCKYRWDNIQDATHLIPTVQGPVPANAVAISTNSSGSSLRKPARNKPLDHSLRPTINFGSAGPKTPATYKLQKASKRGREQSPDDSGRRGAGKRRRPCTRLSMAQPKARQCIDLSEENGKDDASSVSSPPSPAGAMSGRVLGDEKQVPHQGEVKQKVPLQRLNQYMARSGGSRDSYTTSTYFPHDKDTLDESDEADELHGNSFVTTPNMVRGKQKNYSGKGEPAEPAPPAFELYQDPTQHMPSSDIRRSSFEKSGPRMQEDAKKPSNRHKPIEWSLALFRGNDGDDLCYCVMQLDPQHNRFVAGAEGFVISEAPPSRSIEAKRVNRLQYCCADPGYVDLQGPMEHGGSQYRRQLIFNSAAQTEAFLRMLDKQTTIETKQHQKKPVSKMKEIFSQYVQTRKHPSRQPTNNGEPTTRQNPYEGFAAQAQMSYHAKNAKTSRADFESVSKAAPNTAKPQLSSDPTYRRQTRSASYATFIVDQPSPTHAPSTDTNGISKKQLLRQKMKPWTDPVVFPLLGSNRTVVEFDDLSRLDEGEFLNDNIISFYLRYLAETYKAAEKRVFFFNSFFYSRLTSERVGTSGINFDAVARWTSKIDLFSYDYVVIPINQHLHWYLLIICNLPTLASATVSEAPSPSEADSDRLAERPLETESRQDSGQTEDLLATFSKLHTNSSIAEGSSSPTRQAEGSRRSPSTSDADESSDQAVASPSPSQTQRCLPIRVRDTGKQSERNYLIREPGGTTSTPHAATSVSVEMPEREDSPTILVLDSLGECRAATVREMRSYIIAEGKVRRGLEIDRTRLKYMKARGLALQSNYCDCGVFLLAYVEQFMQAPAVFVAAAAKRRLNGDEPWSVVQADDVRGKIRDLLIALHEQQTPGEPDRAKQDVGPVRLPSKQKDGDDSPSSEQDSHAGVTKQKLQKTDVIVSLEAALDREEQLRVIKQSTEGARDGDSDVELLSSRSHSPRHGQISRSGRVTTLSTVEITMASKSVREEREHSIISLENNVDEVED